MEGWVEISMEGWVEISTGRRCRLAYKRATGDPTFLVQNECDSSPFDHQSILLNDHLIETGKVSQNFCLNNVPLIKIGGVTDPLLA